MKEDFNQSLEVDILAAALSIDRQESGDLLELLARKFKGFLPRNTQVKRDLNDPLPAINTVLAPPSGEH